ncbi:MAG: hypothetical protein HQL76_09890 [Magnetococcales bacterium]|nr:hypothetical protein [Magnetococcales bacterium]
MDKPLPLNNTIPFPHAPPSTEPMNEEQQGYNCDELAMLFDMVDSTTLLDLIDGTTLPDCSKP